METDGSIQHSQAPATYPSPEPDQSSLCLPIPHLEDPYFGAFAKLRKATISFIMSCLSVRSHETRLPLDRF